MIGSRAELACTLHHVQNAGHFVEAVAAPQRGSRVESLYVFAR